MSAQEYRYYTTQELADMPITARMVDRRGIVYRPCDDYDIRFWRIGIGNGPRVSMVEPTNSKLAHLKLRRIA